jgi:hypothetical protein
MPTTDIECVLVLGSARCLQVVYVQPAKDTATHSGAKLKTLKYVIFTNKRLTSLQIQLNTLMYSQFFMHSASEAPAMALSQTNPHYFHPMRQVLL